MEILAMLVAVAALSAAAVWWGMSRPDSPRRSTRRLVGFGPAGEEPDRAFVFGPAAGPPARDGRPPPAVSLARLAVVIVVSTAVLVAVAWAIGTLVKLQLDRYFLSGG